MLQSVHTVPLGELVRRRAACRYILVRFFVAEGYADTRERAPLARLRALYEAIKWYKEFILICERYMLIHSSAANSAQCISLGEDDSNQHAARMEKIEQRTHERALREKLLQILSAMRISDLADVPAGKRLQHNAICTTE